MRFFLTLAILVGILSHPAVAENSTPYSGTITVQTTQSFDGFVERLKASIKANKMGIVAEACATCGAAKIGVVIPGNHVIMVYRPDFAVRMLEASTAAGIEAPLRFYVTEEANGMAVLTYRLPSETFGAYQVPALDIMGAELDVILAKIVSDSTS